MYVHLHIQSSSVLDIKENMIIRNFHKKNSYKKNIWIGLLILIALVLCGKGANIAYVHIKNTKTQSTIETTLKRISIKGTIQDEMNFPLHTHKITTTEGNVYFLKSTTYNLNENKGEKEIAGEMIDFNKNIPIINVDAIKYPEQSLIRKGNTYLFPKDLLLLDFEGQTTLSAEKTGKDIIVFFNKKKIFSIERFLCSKILKDKGCNAIIQDFDKNQRENFDSYQWYTFYKHGKWFWTIFDGNAFWYMFKDVEDNILLDISSMIKIIDKKFIIENKKKEIIDFCQKKNPAFKEISFSTTQYAEEKQISIITEDHTNKKNVITCMTTFDMWNDRNIIE